MSLQLILGSSGSGKSYYSYRQMIEEAQRNEKNEYFILVPEQFTMQTQKEIVAMHPDQGIMNLDIVSFLRLAYRIFEEVGKEETPILEDFGKSMILRKILEEKKEELVYFRGNIHKAGFINELKSLISEFCQYRIGEKELEAMLLLGKEKPMLYGKLKDIKTIYHGFKEYMDQSYVTAEEILDVLSDVLSQSNRIKSAILCLDGFTGFTPSQYHLLAQLIRAAKKVWVTVTIDPREDILRRKQEHELFHLSKETIYKLYEIAKEQRVEIEEPIWMKENSEGVLWRFFKSRPLAALEHNLFRYPYQVYNKSQSDISIHCCRDCQEEVVFVMEEIVSLVREENYRYREIAVVSADMETYGNLIEKAFSRAKLPYFLDYKKDILSNPLVECIRSLLEMCGKNFAYESVFRYLRCGLSEISVSDVDKIENYVLAMGIKGWKRWSEPWTRTYQRGAPVNLEELNRIREQFVDSVKWIKEQWKGEKTVYDFTRILYSYLEEEKIYEKLLRYQERFALENKKLLEKEYKQIYGLVLDILDQLVELLGNEKVTWREYEELLETGFSESRIGLIPPGVDQIVIGDIERTRLKDIKALFFLGVNDTVVPKVSSKGGILSDMERELFHEYKVTLAPTKRQSAYIEQFYLYINMTKPGRKLSMTYARTGADGKPKSPSYLVGKMLKLFPEMKIEDYKKRDILGADEGMSYLLDGLKRYPQEGAEAPWKELYCYYYKKDWFKEKGKHLIEGAFYINTKSPLSEAVSKALYGKELFPSVTRLEQYAACAFAHFLTFGLELQERQEFRLRLPDIGTIFHHAIELFSGKVKREGLRWHDLTDEKRDSLAEESVKDALDEFGNSIFLSSNRNEYMIKRVERMTKRTLWALCEQIKQGEFEPVGYEIVFSPADQLDSASIAVSEAEMIRLNGRIDRMDLCENNDDVYMKIIDYKSGNTKFDLEKVYYGLQLQLVVYLNAALELEQKKETKRKVIPAGIFYYNIDDPIIDRPSEEATEEEIRKRLLEELKMNGLANSDQEILRKMDYALEEQEGGKSSIIPVEYTKKGELSKKSQVASTNHFKALTKFAEQKVKQYGKEILHGRIDAKPYLLDQNSPCDYCSYHGICQFDKKLPGNTYRILEKMDRNKIWEEFGWDDAMDCGTTEGD